MNKINILDELTINKIAAGEVVDRPASIVKELVENSIDAGASKITIEIKNGGKDYIRVSDDGAGIEDEDVKLAFLRHSTSKLKTIEDIENLYTNGFRGEALSSISAVSKVELSTNTSDDKIGKKIVLENNEILIFENIGRKKGTSIEIKDLFFNTPARKKFLKSDNSETAAITELINRLAVINSGIAFSYISNGKENLRTIGDGSIYNAIMSIYGKNIASNLLKIEYQNKNISINGYISKSNLYQSNRKKSQIFINKRYIKISPLIYIIEEVYKDLIPIGKYPVFFLDINIEAKYVDPNIHPAKMEVKISEEINLADILYNIIREKLFEASRNLIPSSNYENKNSKIYSSFTKEYLQNDNNFELTEEAQKEEIPKVEFIYKGDTSLEDEKEEIVEKKEISKQNEEANDFKFKDIPFVVNEKMEAVQESFEKIKDERIDYNNIEINGVVFNTYIIASYKESMFLIDQHAGHERVRFEKIRKKMDLDNKKIESQELLIANIIELTGYEYDLVLENRDKFEYLGFNIDDFGYNRIALRSYPILFNKEEGASFFEELVSLLVEEKNIILNDTFYDKFATMACKSAVKANQNLSIDEIKILLSELEHCDNKYTCPHGRPIFVEFSKYDIEKMFKRIV